MKHITIKHTNGFFDLDYKFLSVDITSKRNLFKLEWFVEIYADSKIACVLEAEDEIHAKHMKMKLLNAIECGDSVAFVF